MIGPVSGTGRAMMASLQQAIQKGMPPDQAIQYVKSMATQGVAPLTDLYAMMNQFQRLKQQPVQAPQTPPTIRDQLNMAEQQQAQQQMAMQQGLGGLPAPAMEQAQFAGGGIVAFDDGGAVGGVKPFDFEADLRALIPAGLTETTDIVSFVRKQNPKFDLLSPEEKQQVLSSFEPMYMRGREALLKLKNRERASTIPNAPTATARTATTPFSDTSVSPDEGTFMRRPAANVLELMQDEKLAAERGQERASQDRASNIVPTTTRREVARPAPARTEAAPQGDMFSRFERTPPTLEAERTARLERQRAAKTGEFSQADEDLAAYIKEQKAQGGDTKEAYRNFWVMTGASLMANKSPSFLQALGESVRENYGGLVKDLKDLKDDTKSLRLQEIQLRRAREQAMESGSTADQERVDRLSEKADATNLAITLERNKIKRELLERQHDFALERLRASNRPQDRSISEQLIDMYDAIQKEPDPNKKQMLQDDYERRVNAVEDITRASTAAGVGAPARQATIVQTEVQKAREGFAYRAAARAYNAAVNSNDAAGAQAAKMRMDQIDSEARQRASSYFDPNSTSSVPTMGGEAYTGPYSTSGWN
jgi:hypothetical protein